MAKLAIRGHATRFKEVIEILEMLGGKNDNHCCGGFLNYIYFINDYGFIECFESKFYQNYHQLTLEQFLEKFPYKVGDKVTNEYKLPMEIFDIYWDSDFNTIKYNVHFFDDEKTVRTGLIVEELQLYTEQKEESMEDKGNISECVYFKSL